LFRADLRRIIRPAKGTGIMMDLVVFLSIILGFAALAALAQAFGADSRSWTTEGEHRPWL